MTEHTPHTFTATLTLAGKTATGIQVPEKIVTALGHGKRPPVTVQIKEHRYRNTVAPMGGQYWIGVSAENREAAGVVAGETLEITLTLDTAPREITVPDDLAAALRQDDKARLFFDTISYSNKRWYVTWIESAKREETRQNRVAKAVVMLREGKKQG